MGGEEGVGEDLGRGEAMVVVGLVREGFERGGEGGLR